MGRFLNGAAQMGWEVCGQHHLIGYFPGKIDDLENDCHLAQPSRTGACTSNNAVISSCYTGLTRHQGRVS